MGVMFEIDRAPSKRCRADDFRLHFGQNCFPYCSYFEELTMKRPLPRVSLLFASAFCLAASPSSAAQITPNAAEVTVRSAITRVADDFIKLTLPNGSEGRLKPAELVRLRRTISSESQNGAKARIDWLQTMLVRESPGEVVTLLGTSLPTLGKLAMPDGSPIWFNAREADGPMPLPPDRLKGGVRSGMILNRRMQFLSSPPEEVRAELMAKAGKALPIPAPFESLSADAQAKARAMTAPTEVWDSDLAQ
jgi:hypothetical protein